MQEKQHTEPAPPEGPAPAPDACPQHPIKVLLVEDNVGFSFFIRDALVRQHEGDFCLREAQTLAAALEVLDHEEIDVVLLDLGLPDSVRFKTFARTHTRAPEVPIIILTVLDDDEVAIKALRAGAQDYLVKDHVTKDLLVKAIQYALQRARISKQLHQLSARLLRLQDEERRRIARALHDITGQDLAALSMTLSVLQKKAEPLDDGLPELVRECRSFADKCSRELRTMSYLLHPPLLDELGLAGAVRHYVDGFAERSRIRVDLELPASFERLEEQVETTLFRVMQESLTNIHRHAGSVTASVRFWASEGHVCLDVRDAGRGLQGGTGEGAETAGSLGVGIAGMRERVRQLGGRLEIDSSPKGTTVRARLPVSGGAS